jgi:penicillin-binding protein 1C
MDLLASAYLTLAEDGLAGELAEDLRAEPAPPRRVYARDVARLVVSMLSDAQARQPAFSRYGPLEYAFPVALKTGTSQGWRDAWTVAFSQKYLVVVWIGRGDAGSMRNVTGASAPARIANALLTQLHGLHPGEIAQDEFPAPQGRRRVELCAETAKINDGRCALTLGEFLLESEIDEAQDTGRISLVNAQTTGEKRETRIVERVERRIKIVSPENDVRLWRNPNQPDKLNQIALRAETSPDVKQILWTIDGKPYALAEPGQTIYWPMQSGAHRIQARHALTPGGSAPVRVTVE